MAAGDGVRVRKELVGTKVVDVTLIPFMRSRKIFFRAQGLRPNTRYFPYFGKKAIDDYARTESTFQRFATRSDDASNIYVGSTSHPDGSSNLTSDSEGQLIGSFIIPNTASLKFRSGGQEFKLLDVSGGNDENAISKARANFTARGIIETVQDTVRSTRLVTRTETVQPVQGDRGGRDPLAQSFFVDGIENPNGVFISKIRVYFATKDSVVPVTCQIRSVENGIPVPFPIANASRTISPSSVNIPGDLTDMDNIRSNGTDFEFEEPIYLTSNREYAIVLLAETTEYTVHVAKTYDFIIGSTESRVNKQPTLGSLFMSQNSSTWTPDQDRDLMFQIYRAEFQSSAVAQFNNATVIQELVNPNSMLTDSGGQECIVFMDGHGFSKNDKVFVQGVTNADVDGAFSFASSVLGSRTITKVDHFGFAFNADSNAQSSLLVGGSNMITTRNMMYDRFIPNIQTLIPSPDTTITAQAKKVSGGSYAGTRNTSPAYAKDAAYTNITLNEINRLSSPSVVLNDSNITVHGVSGGSFDMQLTLTTSDTKVSPVVDLQRSSATLDEIIIDKQDVSVTSGFNVPLAFVDETDAVLGSHAAKHITTPVVLEEPAVGIKILFAANRPATAGFRVYYKTGTSDDNLDDISYTELTEVGSNPADENPTVFRQYEYLAGGDVGNLDAFTQYQVKLIMTSTNSSKYPVVRDLRAIALVT